MNSNMTFSYESRPIMTLENDISNKGKQGGINLQPSYQRGFIWENDFKDKLIYSIIRQYPIGNISLRATKDGIREVVDGQQRLTTIYNFINHDYAVKGEYSKKIIEYIINYLEYEFYNENKKDPKLESLKKRLKNKSSITLRYSQLPQSIQRNILAYNISITNISNATDEEIREFFRFLQNQERLRAGEIIKSFPSTTLEKYLDKISNLDLFLNKISFSSNARLDFDKHFYSVIGLLSEKINYGVTDKTVMDFAFKIDHNSLNNTKLIDDMIKNINVIIDNDSIPLKTMENTNVRSTKYLLLLCAFNLVDFSKNGKEKLKKLDYMNNQFSVFNSAIADKEKEVFFGYNEDVIEELRKITLLSKGSHKFNVVKERIEKLAFYINLFDKEVKDKSLVL